MKSWRKMQLRKMKNPVRRYCIVCEKKVTVTHTTPWGALWCSGHEGMM